MSYQSSHTPLTTTSTLAIVSLVFGILTWMVVPVVGAIVAIVCGHLARSEIRHAPTGTVIEGNRLAVAGLVLGYVQLTMALFAIAFLTFFFYVLGVGAFWH